MSEFDAIPDELQARDQWLYWNASSDKPRKPLATPAADYGAAWSDPDEWVAFETAAEGAQSVSEAGIGYVTAADNDDYARGLYGVIDLDGVVDPDGPGTKDWVPSLEPFLERDAYMEYSPSGEGIHIPIVGIEVPEWWADEHFTDDEHEGIEVLTNKFSTFTGDPIDGSGDAVVEYGPWLDDWLREAYKQLYGEDPLADHDPDADQLGDDAAAQDFDGDEWLTREVAEAALEHIPSDVAYPTWRDIGMALVNHLGRTAGGSLFKEWSRGGTKWDREAERQADRIIDDAGDYGYDAGTLVYHASEHGWDASGAARAALLQHGDESGEEEAATDGGATATQPDTAGEQPALSLRERVQRQVLSELHPPEDSDLEPIGEDEARERLADLLCDEYHFVRPREDTRGWRDTLYVYSAEDGIYEPHGETFVQQEVERLMGAWASNQRVREIVGKIERRSRVNERRLEAAPERLVVANGILDLTTGELNEHTPTEYHQTMLDVAYDPDAECPAIDAFLHDVVDDSDVPTLYRLIAHTLYKEYVAEKAAMLLGDGRNGKSVFLSLVEEFLGEWNVSNQSLQELNEDQWAAHNLVGKLANVHPDMSDQTVETMQMFKKLTGRDTVSADVKFEEPVRFQNYATLIFACNRMPVLNDDTRGNWRRWLLIDFPNTFEPDAEETRPKEELMAEMTTEAELQGLLARCVEEIRDWDDGRAWYPTAPSWEEARRRIRRAAEPVYDFAAACLDDSEDYETTDDVRRCYRAYAKAEGLPTMSREEFGRKLLNQIDFPVEKKQKRVNGGRARVYDGLEFTGRGEQLLQGGDTGDDVAEQQSSMGGPRGRKDTVVQLANQHADSDGGVSHDMLVGLAVGEGMAPDQAEAAIQKARNQGDLAGTDEYLPT